MADGYDDFDGQGFPADEGAQAQTPFFDQDAETAPEEGAVDTQGWEAVPLEPLPEPPEGVFDGPEGATTEPEPEPESESESETVQVAADLAAAEAGSTAGDEESPDKPVADNTPRRDKGSLGLAVKSVTDEFVAGTWEPKDGDDVKLALTPHRVAVRLKDRDSLDKAPSTGAITNVFKAWETIGFATMAAEHPLTFGGYTGDGSVDHLVTLTAAAKAVKKAAKDAEKAVSTATAAPAGDVNPEDAV